MHAHLSAAALLLSTAITLSVPAALLAVPTAAADDAAPAAASGIDGFDASFLLAEESKTEGNFTYAVYTDGTALLTGYADAAAKTVAIPDALGGCPVTGIGSGVFRDFSALQNVTVPAGLEFIGYEAFAGTPFYDSLTEEFVLLGHVLLKYNGTSAEAVVPEGVTCIAEAFAGRSDLTGVKLPASLLYVGDHAFDGCRRLSSDLVFRNGLRSIGDYAFNRCQKIGFVRFPQSLYSIGENAFYYCPKMYGAVLPDRMYHLGSGAFYGCESIESVTLPECITAVGERTFASMTGLNTVRGSLSLEVIEKNAFSGDVHLDQVSFPQKSALTGIGEGAFRDTTFLTKFQFPERLSVIEKEAFADTCLPEAILPDSLLSIGEGAFRGAQLEALAFGAGSQLVTVGEQAFSYCKRLTSLLLPASLQMLGSQTFMNEAFRLSFRGDEAAWNAIAQPENGIKAADVILNAADEGEQT